jgi:hypothetical protein
MKNDPTKFASGGLVGNYPSDNLSIALARGSFDLPGEVVRKYGADLISRLNGSATAEEGKVISEMQIKVGGSVIYVDPTGHDRNALVTAVWGPPESNPSINVVVVNDDENQTDTYGRKIERFTSVVHQSNQYAHGNFWKPISE